MKKIFLASCVLLTNIIFSQESKMELYEKMLLATKPTRVFLNKEVIAYSVYQSQTINNKEITKTNKPSLDNPFKIYISSNEEKASIRINNKNMKEDIFFSFNKIYKVNMDNKNYQYEFIGDKNCYVFYTLPKNPEEHQNLIINCEFKQEKIYQSFTISQYHELPR